MIGILASLAVVTVTGVYTSAKNAKLQSDVEALNRSTKSFLGSGGNLTAISDPAEVLVALKQYSAFAQRTPGFSGSKIDPRVTFLLQSEEQASSNQLRAYWDAASSSFVIADSGKLPGIREFVLDDSLAEVDFGTSNATTAFLYAQEDTWVWEYQDGTATTAAGPTTVPTATPPSNTVSPVTVSPTAPTGLNVTQLAPPIYSVTGGTFPVSSFDMKLSFTNPNPTDSSQVYYSIDFGNWQLYTGGEINVPAGANVAAQATAIGDEYRDSRRLDELYEVASSTLQPPTISPSNPTLGLFTDRVVEVTLNNPNDEAISALEYRVGTGTWQPYDGTPFEVNRDDYLDGTTIVARAIPENTTYYRPSSQVEENLDAEPLAITGNSNGAFHSPVGSNKLVTNLTGGTTGPYFYWGEAHGGTTDPSWLQFNNTNFTDISTNQRFEIGQMDYYNGTIKGNTGADAVSLGINLNITINGMVASPSFDFDFELINVPNENLNAGGDPWRSADYVKLAKPIAEQIFEFHGVRFKMKLEFGETSAAGIAAFDEFYVLEDAGARTRLYATLIEVGSAPAP